MTKVSTRDKKTAEQNGVHPAKAARTKHQMSEFRGELEKWLANERRTETLAELQKFFFGTGELRFKANTISELKELKAWLEDMAKHFFMLQAINLFETCYLVEFNHTNRTGVVTELAARSGQFRLMLRVVNESIATETILRRFTEDEQNSFVYGR